jgi:hypothetical protein
MNGDFLYPLWDLIGQAHARKPMNESFDGDFALKAGKGSKQKWIPYPKPT